LQGGEKKDILALKAFDIVVLDLGERLAAFCRDQIEELNFELEPSLWAL
jgi:hypothetical protein